MRFQRTSIGKVMGIDIQHGVVDLDFNDYDELVLKLRGEKPSRVEVYTASKEKGRDYMLGFDFHWKDGSVERMSFKDFWYLFDRNWKWGCGYEEEHGGRWDSDGKWVERYTILSWKYTEVVFQTHPCGCCAFDRIHDRVTGFTADIEKMKESVARFNGECQRVKDSGEWARIR